MPSAFAVAGDQVKVEQASLFQNHDRCWPTTAPCSPAYGLDQVFPGATPKDLALV